MAIALSYEARRLLRRCLHPIEAIPILTVYGLLRLLPLDVASALGGVLARWIGPLLPVHRVGQTNLARAFPDWSRARIEGTLAGVWSNLGRTVAEYPHLDRIIRERVTTESAVPVAELAAAPATAIYFSGHFANWEIVPLFAAFHGFRVISVVRTVNNPYVDWLVRRSRQNSGRVVAKGPAGLRDVIAGMRQGEALGMLVDQKHNAGIAVPFFGREAMTGALLAQLVHRFKCPAYPVRVERLAGAHFRFTIGAPVPLPETGDHDGDLRAAMIEINRLLEDWIRDRPEQWLWLHRRWPRDAGDRVRAK